jgi:hypothetical protein
MILTFVYAMREMTRFLQMIELNSLLFKLLRPWCFHQSRRMIRLVPLPPKNSLVCRTPHLYIHLKVIRLTHQSVMKTILIRDDGVPIRIKFHLDIESPKQPRDGDEQSLLCQVHTNTTKKSAMKVVRG